MTVKDVKIQNLKARLAKQTNSYRAAASEAELKLQQERFINAQSERRKKKEEERR